MAAARDTEACVDVAGYERRARELLPRAMWQSLVGDLGDPDWPANTNNVEGFSRVALRPRVLVDVSQRNLSTTLLGTPVSLPVAITPSGHHQRWHVDGELASARAAGVADALFVLSTSASFSIEEVAEGATGPLWFQLYWLRDVSLREVLVRRAEDAGYRAIVVTVDTPGTRSTERDADFAWDLHEESKLAAALDDDRMLRNFFGLEHLGVPLPVHGDFHEAWSDTFTWRELAWLRELTPLPIVLKGIQCAEDARLAVEHGVDGITVSNHGGFALRDAQSTVEVLPAIADAAAGALEVYLDGGVRKGTDVLKCLALGARAVFIGRAQLFGLAVAGEEGVRHVLEILREELDVAMRLCGVTDVENVDSSFVERVSSSASTDPVTRLERLAALRDRGSLSMDEFATAKSAVLRRL